MRTLLWILVLLALPLVHAASISGTVYTQDLEPASDVLVSIDSTPPQRMIAVDGRYAFQVPPGTYRLAAQTDRAADELAVTIVDDGTYIDDLILFPTETNESDGLPTLDLEFPVQESTGATRSVIVILLLIFLVTIGVLGSRWQWWRRRKAEIPGELQTVLDALSSLGGRATQKQLRSRLPYSEAKVSMMISDLESRGLVRKIKKGRGNLVVRI